MVFDLVFYLEITFIIIAIIALYSYGIKESFTIRDAAKVPTDLLLADWYPKHKPIPTPSDFGFSTQYMKYPIFPSKSSNINNIKQWQRPTNGRCTVPDLCGDFYGDIDIILPSPPISLKFNDTKPRVNFYNAREC
jgi:hypothetical protein